MDNSFIISIDNANTEPQVINLFSGSLVPGVTLTTGDYDYQALQLMARTKAFKGNCITTNYEESLELEIVQEGKTWDTALNGRYEQEPIVLDGFNNYIQLTCPPQKKFYIRLLTLPDVQA